MPLFGGGKSASAKRKDRTAAATAAKAARRSERDADHTTMSQHFGGGGAAAAAPAAPADHVGELPTTGVPLDAPIETAPIPADDSRDESMTQPELDAASGASQVPAVCLRGWRVWRRF